jgi:hypothetical protein
MSQINYDLFNNLTDQLESAVSASGGRKGLRRWIEKNISHPLKTNQRWSWKNHEYQCGIVEDQHPWVATQKAAQTGVSELSLNMALGLCAVLPNANLIYSLQTSNFAKKFATTRFGAAINRSKKVKALLNREVDSTELKQISSSFLHITGAQAESNAISVPAMALINDEISFCSPGVIGALMSRLEHLDEKDKTLIQFSTPLYGNMGISAIFDKGTQHHYMVYHDGCGKWVAVSPLVDIVIPGFDKQIKDLVKSDLSDNKLNIDGSYVKCPSCGNAITRQNLANSTRRAWVPKFQERVGQIGLPHTYQVTPLDVAGIKGVPQVIRSLDMYGSTSKFIQYGLGYPYDSSEGMILPSSIDRAFCGKEVRPESSESVYGAAFGMDVGKTCHLSFAKRVGNTYEFFWFEKALIDGDGSMLDRIKDRWFRFGVLKGISDHGPDIQMIKNLKEFLPVGGFYSGYFTRGGGRRLDAYEEKETDATVAISRTRMLDEFVSDFNKGNIVLPRNTLHKKEISDHLQNMKRVAHLNSTGEEQAVWIATSPQTHYFMSMVYCYTAMQMLQNDSQLIVMPSSGGLIGTARVGSRPNQSRRLATS